MNRATLLALAARVEQAEGRDPMLNQDIQRAVNDGRRALFVPDYTASLDAAASLLKPHQRVSVVVQHETYTAVKVWDARVAMFVGSSSASCEHAEPRARTAAALRAMAEEVGDE